MTAWRVNGTGGGTPAAGAGVAYFLGADHFVYALDAANGQTRWRTPTGTTVGTPPTGNCQIVDSLVACGDGQIIALRAADGTEAWSLDLTPDHPGTFPMARVGGSLYAGSYGHGTMYAINAASGTVRWSSAVLSTDPNGVNIIRIAADSDIVAAAFVRGGNPQTGGVIALDATTGALRWRADFPSARPDSTSAGFSVAITPTVVVGSSTDGKLYVISRASGVVEGFLPGVGQQANLVGLTGPVGEDFRPIAVIGSTLYAASIGSWFVAYDLPTMRELWRVTSPAGSSNGNAIVPDGSVVYVPEGFGHLTAYSATKPAVVWDIGEMQYPFLVGSISVSGGEIFGAGAQSFWAIKK